MSAQKQINAYITSHAEPRRSELQTLHQLTLGVLPDCKIRFHDGKDSDGKTVANPTIGYGSHTLKYANGKTKEWFRIGISANKTGVSVYILGVEDKAFLAKTYGKALGKASVTGYCIKFRSLKDINIDVLTEAIRFGLETK
jgi:hypothetical protein